MSEEVFNNIKDALKGKTELVMKKKLLAIGKYYAVSDTEGNTLCFVNLSWGSNLMGNVVSDHMGKWMGRSMRYTYTLTDANEKIALEIKKTGGAWDSNFNVVEPDKNQIIGIIQLKRAFVIGNMKAQWLNYESKNVEMSVNGNIMRRTYNIINSSGKEIARVRHKIAAIRDTWNLEINSGEDNLYSIIFSTVLDFEKEM